MKRHEQLLQAHFLDKEEEVINQLRQVYGESLKDATAKAEKLQKEFDEAAAIYDTIDDEDEKARLQSIMRSKVYQKKYQESLKGQMSDVLDKMHEKSYTTISQYLDECYTDGFVGAMQSLHKQGIPLAMPIDQKAMVRAVQLDSKISKGLYNHLGEDVATLKKRITAEVSRGISSGLTHEQVASNLAARMTGKYENPGGSMAYAMRIARTEGHRIQCEATFDAMVAAKAKGADIVKQWDSTLDGRTRESHQKLDGEIREVEEKFSNGLLYPGDSSGSAAEVVNCRCALMQRARAGLDDGEITKMNNFTKQLETFESPESYAEFKKGFFSKENVRYMNYVSDMEKKYGTSDFVKVLGSMKPLEYTHYSTLLQNNPLFNKTAATTIQNTASKNVLTNAGSGGIIQPQNGSDETIFGSMIKQQTGMVQNYETVLNDKFAKGSTEAKKAFNKFVQSDSVVDSAHKGTAHFDRNTKKIYMDFAADAANPRGQGTTFFHEHGHYIDFFAAGSNNVQYISINHATFGKLLRDDFKNYAKGIKNTKGYKTIREAYLDVSFETMSHKHHSISDLYGGISKGKCTGRYGHKKSYWTNNSGAIEKEAFAHMFEASFDTEKRKHMQRYFPTAFAEFEKIIKGLI